MKEAIVYSKEVCPFCTKAKELLKDNGVNVTEIMISNEFTKEMLVEEVASKTGIQVDTVPQIFIDGEYVGGCDDLESKLEAASIDTDDLGGFDL